MKPISNSQARQICSSWETLGWRQRAGTCGPQYQTEHASGNCYEPGSQNDFFRLAADAPCKQPSTPKSVQNVLRASRSQAARVAPALGDDFGPWGLAARDCGYAALAQSHRRLFDVQNSHRNYTYHLHTRQGAQASQC